MLNNDFLFSSAVIALEGDVAPITYRLNRTGKKTKKAVN